MTQHLNHASWIAVGRLDRRIYLRTLIFHLRSEDVTPFSLATSPLVELVRAIVFVIYIELDLVHHLICLRILLLQDILVHE